MKYVIYIIFFIILSNDFLFAKMNKALSLDTLLRQSSDVMVKNDNFRNIQKEQIKKIYKANAKFLDKILKKNSNEIFPLIGMTYMVEGEGIYKGIFLLTNSTILYGKEVSKNIIEMNEINLKEMTSDQKEIVSTIKKKYLKNKSELMKYKGDLSMFTFDGVVSLFNIYDSNDSHIFVVTFYSDMNTKELFNCLRKAYRTFSKEAKVSSGS